MGSRLKPRLGPYRSSGNAPPVYGYMPSRGFTRAHLKRQCTARLRARAEPRVYPRPSAIAGAPISHVEELPRPFDDLAQVERLLEDGAGVVLEPGAHVVRLGVAAHDGDSAGEVRVAVNQGEAECEPRRGGELDVEQHGIGRGGGGERGRRRSGGGGPGGVARGG